MNNRQKYCLSNIHGTYVSGTKVLSYPMYFPHIIYTQLTYFLFNFDTVVILLYHLDIYEYIHKQIFVCPCTACTLRLLTSKIYKGIRTS